VAGGEAGTGAATEHAVGLRPEVDQAGAGLLGAMFGVLFFCAFLLIALQITTDLYWRSQIRLVAFDAARVAAQSGGSEAQGEALVQRLLGSRAQLAWHSGPDDLALTVTVPRGSRFVSAWHTDPYRVTVTVHREAFRPSAAGAP
jgi:hypothetical protein